MWLDIQERSWYRVKDIERVKGDNAPVNSCLGCFPLTLSVSLLFLAVHLARIGRLDGLGLGRGGLLGLSKIFLVGRLVHRLHVEILSVLPWC